MARAFSVKEALAKKNKVLEFTGEWAGIFDRPQRTGVWFIWGASGNGKSSFVMQLAKELCRHGKVAYDSLEEGVGRSFQNTLNRYGMDEVSGRLSILNYEPIEELEARMDRLKSPDFYIIDSFQCMEFNSDRYKQFVARHANKLLIFVSHAEGSKPKGRTAQGAANMANERIFVEGFKAISRGRSSPKGEYIIWAEGAEKYWGSKAESNQNNQ